MICAVYILSYITKGQRETASKEANAGNKDIVNRVRHIGNKFLKLVEIIKFSRSSLFSFADAFKEINKRIPIYQRFKSRRKNFFVENT